MFLLIVSFLCDHCFWWDTCKCMWGLTQTRKRDLLWHSAYIFTEIFKSGIDLTLFIWCKFCKFFKSRHNAGSETVFPVNFFCQSLKKRRRKDVCVFCLILLSVKKLFLLTSLLQHACHQLHTLPNGLTIFKPGSVLFVIISYKISCICCCLSETFWQSINAVFCLNKSVHGEVLYVLISTVMIHLSLKVLRVCCNISIKISW